MGDTGWRTTSVIGFEGGAAFVPGRSPGGFGRFILNGRDHGAEGSLSLGWMMAVEAWRAKNAGGGALPVIYYLGIDSRRVFFSLDFGVNLCNFDILDGKAGGGVFSPRASTHLGVRIADVYVGLDAGVQRRVMWKLDDITLFTAGFSFGFVYREKMSDPPKFT